MTSSQMYNVVITNHFKKQLKKLVKKDTKLKANLKNSLQAFQRKKAIPIGSNVYKVRIPRRGRGKSGGYRAYLLVLEIDGILAPISIYAKNEKENLNYKELTRHLRSTKDELSKML